MTAAAPSPDPGAFHTTRWTLVLQAGGGDAPGAQAALGELCEAYWEPVFRFLRREGRDADTSRELAQAFFARLLGGAGITGADPRRGRFRSYLLGALKHFLADQRRDARRLKRGGGQALERLDGDGGEAEPAFQIADPNAAPDDREFDRQWALAVMERGLAVVEAQLRNGGKARQFEVLKPWLAGDAASLDQAAAAAELGMTSGAVKVAVHRLRERFRKAVRDEIAQTVEGEEEIAGELRYLVEVLA